MKLGTEHTITDLLDFLLFVVYKGKLPLDIFEIIAYLPLSIIIGASQRL